MKGSELNQMQSSTAILDTYVSDAVKTFGTTFQAGLFQPVGRFTEKLTIARKIAKGAAGSRIARLMDSGRKTIGYQCFVERA
jgi:hypothetical protein